MRQTFGFKFRSSNIFCWTLHITSGSHSKSVDFLNLILVTFRVLILRKRFFGSCWHWARRHEPGIFWVVLTDVGLAFEVVFWRLSEHSRLNLRVLVLVHIEKLPVLVDYYRFQVNLLGFGSNPHLVLKAHDVDVGHWLFFLNTLVGVMAVMAPDIAWLALVFALVTCILSISVHLSINLLSYLRWVEFRKLWVAIVFHELALSCRFRLMNLHLDLLLLKFHHVFLLNFLLDLFESHGLRMLKVGILHSISVLLDLFLFLIGVIIRYIRDIVLTRTYPEPVLAIALPALDNLVVSNNSNGSIVVILSLWASSLADTLVLYG